MIVISDTSPLQYLVRLGEIELLPRLFGQVFTPPEVIAECVHRHAPLLLRRWASDPPAWLIIEEAPAMLQSDLERLDPGEAAAIRLAIHKRASILLIDERKGRRIAGSSGLAVAGVLALLGEAAFRRWIDFDSKVQKLRSNTNFRVSDAVVAEVRSRLTRAA